jgi:hypothetical protein
MGAGPAAAVVVRGRAVYRVRAVWGRAWEPISGRVVASEICSRRDALMSRHKYVIEYRVDAGQVQRVELKQPWPFWRQFPKIINPPKGSAVPLLLNRGSGKLRFDVKNPAINRKASLKANKASRDADFSKALND